MKLYELILKDGFSVSPFVWRVKMALAHKGITPEIIPIGYGDKDQLEFSGQDRVPVIVDDANNSGNSTVVSDSFAIAEYLEDTYTEQPSLFGGPGGRAAARFMNMWADSQQLGKMFLFCTPGTFERTPEADQPYFRESRMEWTGLTIEQMAEMSDDKRLADFRNTMTPVRETLRVKKWLGGDGPAFPDYCVFGGFMWARTTMTTPLLEKDDPIEDWRQRMLDLFDGLARKAPSIEND